MKHEFWKPGRLATLISAVVFVAGAILSQFASPYFILLCAVATLLPDLARLIGILRDSDEFQELAAGRSSRLACALALVYAALMYGFFHTGFLPSRLAPDAWLIGFTLIVVIRYAAYLLYFWDASTGARWLFLALGLHWAVFSLMSGWEDGLIALLPFSLVILIFGSLALLAGRFPLATGIASLVMAITSFVAFDMYRLLLGDLGAFATFLLLPLPFLIAGIGLIRSYARKKREPAL